ASPLRGLGLRSLCGQTLWRWGWRRREKRRGRLERRAPQRAPQIIDERGRARVTIGRAQRGRPGEPAVERGRQRYADAPRARARRLGYALGDGHHEREGVVDLPLLLGPVGVARQEGEGDVRERVEICRRADGALTAHLLARHEERRADG